MARLSDAEVKALTDDIPTRNVIHMLQMDKDKLEITVNAIKRVLSEELDRAATIGRIRDILGMD